MRQGSASVNILMLEDLKKALTTDQFFIVLQPKMCVQKKTILGAEVLLRWAHPSYAHLPVSQWIAVAQQNHLLPAITRFVAEKTIALLKKIEFSSLLFSFNISPCCLTEEFTQFIIERLEQEKISPHRLIVEITESTEALDMKIMADNAQRLREAGLKISLDDFGVGFSSMKYLVDIQADYVKIDKEFVQKAPFNKTASIVLKTLIDVAQDVNLIVVVEGVETLEQFKLVKKFGANCVQGFLFSEPLSFLQFLQFCGIHPLRLASPTSGKTIKKKVSHRQAA